MKDESGGSEGEVLGCFLVLAVLMALLFIGFTLAMVLVVALVVAAVGVAVYSLTKQQKG